MANDPTPDTRSGDDTDIAAPPRLPTVVIIGRPNVGKSTLFNRVVGHQEAIVEDRPGITRDRKDHEAEWLDVPFLVVDTGGWMPGGDSLEAKVSRQVEAAVKEADVVLFVVDASVGLTDDDQTIANWIRRTQDTRARRRQQVRQRAARDRDVGVHEPRARRAGAR